MLVADQTNLLCMPLFCMKIDCCNPTTNVKHKKKKAMNLKRFFGLLLVALMGGLISLGLYTMVFRPETRIVTATEKVPVTLPLFLKEYRSGR